MKKLRNKVFFTIFFILTLSICSFIVVFHVQNYNQEKNSIISSLNNIISDGDKLEVNSKQSEPPFNNSFNNSHDTEEGYNDIDNWKYMDSVVYTVLLDSHNNVLDVINHSSNDITDEEIEQLAMEILEQSSIPKRYIGCLYFQDYSYSYTKGKSLIILDNSDIQSRLVSRIEVSIVIFIVMEFFIFVISRLITKWIIKPVEISFDKQKQFIADASHELKTPLSVIVASSEALEEEPKQKKWLRNIKSEADRMNLLLTELLELARSESEVPKNLEIGNLSKVVELSVLTFEGKTFEKNLKLDFKIEDDIKIKMNENNIRQLVEILLDNAIQHSKKNGYIEVSLKQSNNDIVLMVINQGEAIPKGEEDKIFERFYRVDKSRNRNENRYGLGLAIAKNIVENHNGKISASSDKGVTTFKVVLKKL